MHHTGIDTLLPPMVAMLIHVVPVMTRMLFASQHGSVVTVAMLHDVIAHTLLHQIHPEYNLF